jgi:hypothetical protein
MKKYEVLTPDGIRIEPNKTSYPTMNKAKNALELWIRKYEVQGYYASNNGKISLNELERNCQINLL